MPPIFAEDSRIATVLGRDARLSFGSSICVCTVISDPVVRARTALHPQLFQLPQLRAGNEYVNGGVDAVHKPAPTVAKPLQVEVSIAEGRPGPEHQIMPAKSRPVLHQLVSLIAGVAVEVAHAPGNGGRVVMDQVALERRDFSRYAEVRMHLAGLPASLVAPKQTDLIVGVESAVLHPPAQKMIPTRHA